MVLNRFEGFTAWKGMMGSWPSQSDNPGRFPASNLTSWYRGKEFDQHFRTESHHFGLAVSDLGLGLSVMKFLGLPAFGGSRPWPATSNENTPREEFRIKHSRLRPHSNVQTSDAHLAEAHVPCARPRSPILRMPCEDWGKRGNTIPHRSASFSGG